MTHGMIIEQIPPILHAVCILKLFFIQIVIYKKQEKSVPFTGSLEREHKQQLSISVYRTESVLNITGTTKSLVSSHFYNLKIN